jgi:hypothetical protein
MEDEIADQPPTRAPKSRIPTSKKLLQKNKVLPGIEPGLPEDTDFEIRIRSDNRYLVGELAGASVKCWFR